MRRTHDSRQFLLDVLAAAALWPSAAAFAQDSGPPGQDVQTILRDSFEEGAESPAGWAQGAAVDGVEYAWAEGEASAGERSLCLKKSAARFFPIAQWSRKMPHRGESANIEVSVMVKAVDAAKGVVDVEFVGGDGRPLGHQWIAYIGPKEEGQSLFNHDWGRYAAVTSIPPGTRQLVVGLQVYGPGSIWFDELEARYVESPGSAASATADAAPRDAQAAAEMPAEAEAPAGAISVTVKGDATGEYLLSPPAAEPAGLVVVLPGGDGSAEFHPFVSNIARTALQQKYAVAQPIAPQWRPNQAITWPTLRNRAPGMKYSTEELVGKVIADVAGRHKIDRSRVYLLAWSSGGPAAYAIALHEKSPVSGSLIAMSVFKPRKLPPLKFAAKRNFYLLHSPDDQVCPYGMAQQAEAALGDAGARVQLATYAGGHGWHGDVFENIRAGFEWIDNAPPQPESGP